MSEQINSGSPGRRGRFGSCLLSTFWLGVLSLTTSCVFVLCALVTISVALNVYLGWASSGVEVVINIPAAGPTATMTEETLAVQPTNTPESILPTPTMSPTATEPPTNTPTLPPSVTPTPRPTSTPIPTISSSIDTTVVPVNFDDFSYDETDLENVLRPLYQSLPAQNLDTIEASSENGSLRR